MNPDIEKLLDLLVNKETGVRMSKLLMSNFKGKSGKSRLIKALRQAKANVEVYPHPTGHHVVTLFHPTIEPHSTEELEKSKQIFNAFQKGAKQPDLAKEHGISQQAISKRIDSHLRRRMLKGLLMGTKNDRSISALSSARQEQHLQPPEQLAARLVNFLKEKGPLSKSQFTNTRLFTKQALQVAEEHALKNNQITTAKLPSPLSGGKETTMYSLPDQDQKTKYKLELPQHSHPAISGTELSHYLRTMADKYKDDEHVPALVHSILTGGHHEDKYDPSALLPLNDRLQELEEPTVLTHYDLPKAVSGLHLDNAMNTILNTLSYNRYRGRAANMTTEGGVTTHETPMTFGEEESGDIRDRAATLRAFKHNRRFNINKLYDHLKGTGAHLSSTYAPAIEGIKLLKEQGHTDEDLLKSLRRHQHKNEFDRPGESNSNLVAGAMLPAENEYIKGRRYKSNVYSERFLKSIPLKYFTHKAISSFIQAIRQLRSKNQEVRRVVPFEQYKKMGIKVDHILDSVADTTEVSTADTSHVLSHDGNLDNVRAAVALVAQQLNTPSYLTMHEHKGGPDALYQFDVHGGADDFRTKLNSANIRNRAFIQKPDGSGWWAMVYDKGNKLKNTIGAFSETYKLDPRISFGTGEFIGNGQNTEATKEDRQGTLKNIKTFENTGKYPTEINNGR